jgi:hypothetical protein
MVEVRYRGVMTMLMLLVGGAAAIATLFGYIAWRDRHGRRSFVESASIRRGAPVHIDEHAVHDRLLPKYYSSHRAGSVVDAFDAGS